MPGDEQFDADPIDVWCQFTSRWVSGFEHVGEDDTGVFVRRTGESERLPQPLPADIIRRRSQVRS